MKSFKNLLENKEKWIGTDKHNVSMSRADLDDFQNISKPVNMDSFEDSALKSYSGIKYGPMNRHLRGTKQHSTDNHYIEKYVDEDIKQLKSAISKHTIQHPAHVWRGMNVPDSHFEHLKEGDVLHDKGFVSTSLSPNVARDFSSKHVAHIKLPKGSKALYRNHYNFASGEHEVILPPDSKFKYLGKEEMPSGKVVHRMEHIPE